ncbi:MAG: LAGLIDADG family homing endonuclease [Candidatus Pacearchaeota archaeon]
MEKKGNEEFIVEAKAFFETYKKEIGESIRRGKKVVFVNFEDLASSSPVLAEALMTNPEEILLLLETALEETGLIKNPRIRFRNLPETQKVKIRTIRANHLNQLIFFEGLVRQTSEVRPQVVNAKFECPSCGTVISVLQIEKKFREPTRCSCGRKGQFRLISKTMVDAQRLVIEESPESLTGGEQPRRLPVFLKEDLVEPIMEEKTTPGSKVRVIGILKEVPVPLQTGAISTRFDLAIEANNLIPLESTYEDLEISEEDERQIQELAEDPELFHKLRDSIAPGIWGYEEVKEALVLQMFGGVHKKTEDGSAYRGDIHLFLMGDPGVAKSIGKNEKIMYFSEKESGYEPIEKLYNKFGKFPKNLKILTIDMKTHEPKWENVSEIIKHLPEKDLIEIETEHGKNIIGTKDHSFITLAKNGEIISIKGEDLTKNTYFPIPINYHNKILDYFYTDRFNKKYSNNSKLLPEKISLNEDFGFFIGIFLAEGCIQRNKEIALSNKNKDIQNKIINFAEKIKLNYSSNEKSIYVYSKNLAEILKFYCYDKEKIDNIKKGAKGNYSRIKKIPEFSYFAPKEFIYGLISGLFSGDGRLIKDNKMLKGFELITISKMLAQETSDLLFSIGIINKLKTRNYTYKNNKTDYFSISIPTYMIKEFLKNMNMIGRTIKINEKDPIYSYNNLIPCGDLIYEVVKKLGYNSRITGNRTLAAEMRTIKKRNEIGRLRLLRLIKEFERKSSQKIEELEILKKIANSSILWSKIKQIKILKKKNEEVYDLSVPSTNTFVANGIGVHNSMTLKFISNIAPRGRYIVGRATSGAGITASVVKDEFLKGWSLEAGAMVLANKGIVCIDEIEKMDATDRSAMHEALEQQTVTISKANIQACYSEDTEVLTEYGWKKFNEVKNFKIAQVNSKTKSIEFLPHKGLFIYDYSGKMYYFKNKRNDILVTPNHKMLLREERKKHYEEIKAENIQYSRIRVLNSGDYIAKPQLNHFILNPIEHKQNRKHPKYTHQHTPKKIPINLWLEFLGYYLSEGGICAKPTISITQKDKIKTNKIKKCLTELSKHVGFTLTEIKKPEYTKFEITNTQLYEFLEKLGHKSYNKNILLNLSELSKGQLKIIYNAMMLGDGSSDEKNYCSTSQELADLFQAIACLIGKSASKNLQYKEKYRGNRKAMHRIILSNKTELSLRKEKNHIQKINYNGKVFCFSTETGFFITRRNGKIAIQGNTLSAQTSVLAAGNPKFGRFEPTQPITQQIDLPPALINRFDIIFILRDLPNKQQDEAIASHVLKMHQKKEQRSVIERDLFRKYVAYAKQKFEPILTNEAFDEIKSYYVKLRNMQGSGDTKSIPISARQLQALVRLAEAHAKSRLSKKVKKEDAEVAIRLINYYLMHVGFDPETKTFDIDRVSIGTTSSQRSKIILVKETIRKLEEKFGKQVPLENVKEELKDLSDIDFDEALEKLKEKGDIYQPRAGFIQLI